MDRTRPDAGGWPQTGAPDRRPHRTRLDCPPTTTDQMPASRLAGVRSHTIGHHERLTAHTRLAAPGQAPRSRSSCQTDIAPSSVVTILVVMTSESLATVKATLSEVIDRVERYHERVVVTRRGREAAVILSPEDLRSLEETIAVLSDPATMRRLEEADAAIATGDVVDAQGLRAMIDGRRQSA
jgi:antitoxin YefM